MKSLIHFPFGKVLLLCVGIVMFKLFSGGTINSQTPGNKPLSAMHDAHDRHMQHLDQAAAATLAAATPEAGSTMAGKADIKRRNVLPVVKLTVAHPEF